MASLIDEPPCPYFADFVDGVGKLIATILDMDLGVVERQVTAVDVSDAAHGSSVDTEGFELSVQRRTLHADKFGGAGDVAAEAIDLRQQIFALEHFARLAQREAHQVLAAIAVRH